ncbi:MAG: glycosyltransferase family 9 protein, partial [Chloroflexota bacterium]
MGAPSRLGIKQRIRGAALGLALRSQRRKIPPAGKPPDRILVVRPDHLGDLLLSTPALRLLRTAVPHAQITLLTGPWNAEAAGHITSVDEVATIEFPWFDRRQHIPPWNPYLIMRQAAAALRDSQFNAAVILRHDFWYGAALAAAAGIPLRTGYDLPETRPFLTELVPFPGEQHEAAQAYELVRAAFAPSTDALPGPAIFQVTPQERAEAGRWLSENAATGPVFAVHPGAGAAVKLWGAEPFGALVRALRDQYRATVVLTGGNTERRLVEQIASRAGGAVPELLGAPLGVLAAVLQSCTIAVGVDSGIMHLAAAVGTPPVRLF